MSKDGVFLLAGSLVFVPVDFSELWRKDVLNSLLFSQLHANSKGSRFARVEQWCADYTEAMGMMKWNRQVFRGYDFEPDKDEVVVLNDLVQKKIFEVLGTNQFEQMMGCVEQSPDPQVTWAVIKEHAVAIGQSENASEVSSIVLQVRLLGEGPIIYSAVVCINTSEKVEVDFFNQRFLGCHVVGKVTVDVARHVLDKAGYERSGIREKVLGQLLDTKDTLVLDLSSKYTCLLE